MAIYRRSVTSTMLALVLTIVMVTSTFAHVCTNANKLPGAGSVGTYNIATGEFIPGAQFNPNRTQLNGGFVTLWDGGDLYVDIYVHDVLPDGALAAGPDGDNLCDGRGVDLFLACIGAVGG